ncbi:hypothetical protein BAE44_0005139, partial [Dichanthelium oligosanthes]
LIRGRCSSAGSGAATGPLSPASPSRGTSSPR